MHYNGAGINSLTKLLTDTCILRYLTVLYKIKIFKLNKQLKQLFLHYALKTILKSLCKNARKCILELDAHGWKSLV